MDAEEPVDDTRQAAWKLFDGADGVVAVAATLAAEVKSLRAENTARGVFKRPECRVRADADVEQYAVFVIVPV